MSSLCNINLQIRRWMKRHVVECHDTFSIRKIVIQTNMIIGNDVQAYTLVWKLPNLDKIRYLLSLALISLHSRKCFITMKNHLAVYL